MADAGEARHITVRSQGVCPRCGNTYYCISFQRTRSGKYFVFARHSEKILGRFKRGRCYIGISSTAKVQDVNRLYLDMISRNIEKFLSMLRKYTEVTKDRSVAEIAEKIEREAKEIKKIAKSAKS